MAEVPEQAKPVANWIMGELGAALNRENISINDSRVSAQMLAGLVKRIADGTDLEQAGQTGIRSLVGRWRR